MLGNTDASLQQPDDQLKDVLVYVVIKQQAHMLFSIFDCVLQSIICAGAGSLGMCQDQHLTAAA